MENMHTDLRVKKAKHEENKVSINIMYQFVSASIIYKKMKFKEKL